LIEGIWRIRDPLIHEDLLSATSNALKVVEARLEEFPLAELRAVEFAHTIRNPDGELIHEMVAVDVCDLLAPTHDITRLSSVESTPANENDYDSLADQQQTALSIKPVSRSVAQDKAILAKLSELGFDPMNLPPYSPGRASLAKQEVKKALHFSDAVFDKTWLRLKTSGQISYE
jgi:hypothetical protein